MGSLTRSGATCPQCHQPVHLRRDGSMADHKTDKLTVTGLPGRRTKQACPYSGVTPEEAKAGKTRVAKRREQHREKQSAGTTQVQQLQRERDAELPTELQRKPAKKAARQTGPDKLTVEVVIHRDRGQCAWCGHRVSGERGVGWSVQHRRPRRMGGDRRPDSNSPANLVLLCGSATTLCHLAAESQRAIAYNRGVLLRDTDIPSRVAIEHAVHGWVYLSDDGEAVTEPPVRSA